MAECGGGRAIVHLAPRTPTDRPAGQGGGSGPRDSAPSLRQSAWDDDLLAGTSIPIVDSPIVTVGGGLGSFAFVDVLRIAGMGVETFRVLSNLSAPHETFAALADASQLRAEDRLRSDSSSRIDNIWGWPGYAVSEAVSERTLVPLWKVFAEPLLSEYFTPRVGTVVAGVDREAARIGWNDMLVRCHARVVRRRAEGGYFVLVRLLDGEEAGDVVYRCRFVHLALGYPGPRHLPDLLALRDHHGGIRRVIHGYECHDEVYEGLVRSPGRVILRGAGITASRILQRLIHDRDRLGARTEIVHVFRTYVRAPSGPPWFRRAGGEGFAYQPFNFPKAAGGGQLRQRTLSLPPDERAELIRRMGGTTTARRRSWQRQLARGRREGWYRAQTGTVTGLGVGAAGRLTVTLSLGGGAAYRVDADYLIDATGMDEDMMNHPLIADLLACSGAAMNELGGLDVAPSFEVLGTRSGVGRLYATGAVSRGGALAPVDSFWGLTHAALEICDDLADQGVCQFPHAVRSIGQWLRWMRNRPP